MNDGRTANGSGKIRVGYSSRLGPISAMEREILDLPDVELVEIDLMTRDAIVERSAGFDYLVVGAVEPFDRLTIEEMSPVRMIVRRGAGVDNVDVDAASERDIAVVNVPDASIEEVSDHALALSLTVVRRVSAVDRLVRSGESKRARALQEGVLRFSEMSVGVIGLGRIGYRFAEKARSLVREVVGYDPDGQTPPGVRRGELFDVLVRADVVSIHIPLNDETRLMFGSDLFGKMKRGAVFVNTSRGEVVDEAALAGALESGQLSGAGLDVLTQDPPAPDHPLLEFDNVVVTAHTAGRGVSASRDLRRRSIGAVADVLRGDRPPSILNPQVWSGTPESEADGAAGPIGSDLGGA